MPSKGAQFQCITKQHVVQQSVTFVKDGWTLGSEDYPDSSHPHNGVQSKPSETEL